MEAKVVEKYNGHIGISGAWLGTIFGRDNVAKAQQRGLLRSLRRGGNGRTALIDWESMGTKMKRRVVEALGSDPAAIVRESLLREIMRRREDALLDTAAWEYYAGVRGKDGRYLKPEKVTELWNGARILDAIDELLEEKRRAAELGRVKLSMKREFAMLAVEVDQNLVEYPHSLPTSGDRLRKKYNEYKLHGYGVLVHGLTGRASNHRARSVEVESVVEALIASGAKLNDAQVSKAAEALGVKIDRRRVQEVRTKNAAMLTMSREGRRAYESKVAMQVDRERPRMPLKMWSLDGWTVELYYQERTARGVSHWKRLVAEVVVDVMNDYPIGYALGEEESAELITAALRDAVRHTRDVFGGYYAPWQIQSDHFALKAMSGKYGALAKYVTPAAVGNAKAKPVERYFATLESEYLWVLVNNGGHNITARSQANDEYLNAHKYYFPDRAGLEAQVGKIMEIERSRKIGAMREAWAAGGEEEKRELNMEQYLMAFGETGRGNMLTPNGLKVIRDGVEYKFDCFDIEMRKHSGERWTLRYDLGDMNQALAVSEDGRLRYMMEAKKRVPMALADYEEEDWKALAEYRAFNQELSEARDAHVGDVKDRAREFVSREQLEGPLSALLLTEGGQHKRAKRREQREKVEYVDYVEVEENGATARRAEDIFDKI